VLRLERGSLEPENIYGQEKLCTKNPTGDCRCGQIKARTKDCAKGNNRRGDYCRRRSRRSRRHEVNGRPERPDAENRGERAVWKKRNEDGQDRAKEKTLIIQEHSDSGVNCFASHPSRQSMSEKYGDPTLRGHPGAPSRGSSPGIRVRTADQLQ
jgi:hypothetical protein